MEEALWKDDDLDGKKTSGWITSLLLKVISDAKIIIRKFNEQNQVHPVPLVLTL